MVYKDFIDKHYYKYVFDTYIYYFKYDEKNSLFEDNCLYAFYEIKFFDNTILYRDSYNYMLAYYPLETEGFYEEVSFTEFVDYLPDTNTDKIIYMRKQKIKHLLK